MVRLEVATVKRIESQRFSLLKDQEGWCVDIRASGNHQFAVLAVGLTKWWGLLDFFVGGALIVPCLLSGVKTLGLTVWLYLAMVTS